MGQSQPTQHNGSKRQEQRHHGIQPWLDIGQTAAAHAKTNAMQAVSVERLSTLLQLMIVALHGVWRGLMV